MTGIEGATLNTIAPLPPQRYRSARLDIPGIDRSLGAPKRENRTGDTPPARTIRFVMLAIDGRGGSILLADGMYVDRIPKSLNIGRTDVRREYRRGRAPTAERVVDNGLRYCRQDALRKGLGLSEERSGPVREREPRVGAVPYGPRRQDIEDGQAVDAVRMIESHAIGDATAAIMPRDREVPEPKPLHDDHHVVRHGPLPIWRMIRRGDGAATAPVAAKIGADDRKVAGKDRRDAASHQVGLRKAVQQEDRGPGPVRAREDSGFTGLHLGGCGVIHLCSPGAHPFRT